MPITFVFKTPPAFLILRTAGSLVGLLVSACQPVGPDYHLPREAAIHRSDLQGQLAVEGAGVVSTPPPVDWWRLYEDPRLDTLVLEATASNADLRVAAANLQRAYDRAQQADSAGGWSANADAGVQRAQESAEAFLLSEKVPVVNTGNFGISTSYQFDLFGTLQRGIEGAKADADAAQAAADVARITLVADVVRSYVQVCAANEELEIAQQSLALQDENTRLVRRLRDAGRGDETQVTRAQTQYKSLKADMPRYTAQRQAGLFQLSMLLAKPLDQLPMGTAQCETLPTIRQLLPVGDGTAMLKRRPDVRQAERQLAAATARIGVATGALYPAISFGVSGGATGILEHVGESRSSHWALGPLISWSVPTNGARARIHEAQDESQGALAHFDAVVLNAIRETQTDLVRYTTELQRRDALFEAEQSAQVAADQTHRFYQAGRVSFLAELQANATYTASHAAVADADSQVAMGQIDLFLALGGGWERGRPQAHQ